MTTNEHTIRPRLTFIFAPGLKPEMYPKALNSGTDIVCVELEDGIAPKDKDDAREKGLALFASPQADDGVERIVRINCLRTAFGLADVNAVLATDTPPPALMLPKVMTADEIIWLDDLLSERGHDTRLHIIIETNASLEAIHDIAQASTRIDALFLAESTWQPSFAAKRVGTAALCSIKSRSCRRQCRCRCNRRPLSRPGRPRRYGARGHAGEGSGVQRQGLYPSETDSDTE